MKLTVTANHHDGMKMNYIGSSKEVNDNLGKQLIEKGLAKEYEKSDEKKYTDPTDKAEKVGREKEDGFISDLQVSEKVQKNANGTNKKA